MDPYCTFTKKYHHSVYPAIEPSQKALSAQGKVVLITGGSQGIGKAIARAFILTSAEAVIITGRTKQTLANAVTEIKLLAEEKNLPTQILYYVNDTVDSAGLDKMFTAVEIQFGRIDILISNAGVVTEIASFAESDPDQWWGALEINTKGGYNTVHNFLKIAKQGAVIINVSSMLAHIPVPAFSSYSASKIALHFALETLQQGNRVVRVHNLHPGMIAFAMNEGREAMMEDEVELPGSFAVWLASPEATFMAGRLAWANWDVEELKEMSQEIVNKDLCVLRLAV